MLKANAEKLQKKKEAEQMRIKERADAAKKLR